MVVNSLKALLFVAGGTVVAAGAAYITGALDVFFPEKPQVVAVPQPESTGAQQPPAMAVGQPGAGKPAGEQMAALPAGGNAPAAADPATTGKEDRLVVPSFDLVRVEPDGSLVIAGQAAPNAKVEVVTGSSVIGTDKAGAGGDFAVVLDDPLKPGDYTIVLRSTTPDNVVATSEETAVVSVPETQSGQVLALVEKPGAPSKLITVPQAQAAADKQDRPVASDKPAAAQEPKPEQPAAMAAAQPQEKPAAGAAATDAGTAAAGAAPSTAQPGGQMAALPADKQEPAATGKPAEQAQAAADTSSSAASGAPQQFPAAQAGEQNQAGQAAQAGQPAQTGQSGQAEQAAQAGQAAGAASSGGQQQVAAAQPEQTKPVPMAEKPRISVEAVEIEGSRVFVAGRTEPGGRVRVYANEILLGDAKASPGGQFLVEAQRELPVGDYIVRADLLGPRAEVLARAAVPFEREPGESIAAVAASEPAAQEAEAAAPKPQAEAQKTEAGASPAGTQHPAAGAKPSTAGGQAAAGSQTAAAEAPAQASGGAAQSAGAKPAGDAASAAAPAGQGAAPAASAQGGQQMAAASAGETKTDAGQPAPAGAAAPADGGAAVASAAGEQDVTAPKLKSVAGAVIIRRGDTLWRISRRVYGLGVRYTTIYLANQDQISDPDRIWPGQVFSVPDKTGDGEEADMSAVADRVVPVE